MTETANLVTSLASQLGALALAERVEAVRAGVPGRIVFTTSFGLEDQVLTHAILTAELAIEVVTLDTGRLFPETYALWGETERRYGRRLHCLMPEGAAVEALVAQHGIEGFRASLTARHACCGVRKVEPLRRALTGAAVWITGIRADQSEGRSAMALVEHDALHHVLKVNPLLDWTRSEVSDFIRQNDVPHNPLHDRGFASIGCAPCTRAVVPGEPERAGRWWWEREEMKECGLHVGPDGRLAPLAKPRATHA
jgi:phosphoadenosine phosphosulfate reductase